MRILGIAAFLGLFIANVMFTVKKDPKTGKLSLNQLQASAQTSGEGFIIRCDPGHYGQCSILVQRPCFTEYDDGHLVFQVFTETCQGGGTMDDCCDESMEDTGCDGWG